MGLHTVQVALEHGTRHSATGEELEFPVTLLEAQGEEAEDTVFTEEDQRLVRQRLRGMEQRQAGQGRQEVGRGGGGRGRDL